jgi:hypothetical protein
MFKFRDFIFASVLLTLVATGKGSEKSTSGHQSVIFRPSRPDSAETETSIVKRHTLVLAQDLFCTKVFREDEAKADAERPGSTLIEYLLKEPAPSAKQVEAHFRRTLVAARAELALLQKFENDATALNRDALDLPESQRGGKNQAIAQRARSLLAQARKLNLVTSSSGTSYLHTKLADSSRSLINRTVPLEAFIRSTEETLAGKLESGFRPSFSKALRPELAKERFARVQADLKADHSSNAALQHHFGVFGADMELSFTNWGPLTLPLQI